MKGELHRYPDAPAVARALADLFVEIGREAQTDRGAFRVALAGGTTPRAAYALLREPGRCEFLSWSDTFIYFGDERCVPPTDEQSNYKMAHDAFLASVGIPTANVHRMLGEIDPHQAADRYAAILREDMGALPRFDLVMLGLGPDGHTASLFPGTSPLTDTDRLVRAVCAETMTTAWRTTITPSAINAARAVVFAVEGAAKASILAAVREGPADPTTYPAQIVAPTDGRLLWLVDEAAAVELRDG